MGEIVEIYDPQNWIPANVPGGQLFAKCDQIAGVVRLNNVDGHLMALDNGEWGISAEGYRTCNIVAGIPSITPETMKIADGREVSNPYIEFDPVTGTADKFWSQKITIGKHPLGNLVVSSATVLFDLRVRFVKELIRKIEENQDAGKLCINGTLSEEELKNGLFMAFQGDLGVYGKHSSRDVIGVIQNLINNKEHGDKIVQTLAWKASMKQQPCMPPTRIKVFNNYTDVLISGYKLDFTQDQLHEIATEYRQTGKVEGAVIFESTGSSDNSESSSEISLLSNEGGPRF